MLNFFLILNLILKSNDIHNTDIQCQMCRQLLTSPIDSIMCVYIIQGDLKVCPHVLCVEKEWLISGSRRYFYLLGKNYTGGGF